MFFEKKKRCDSCGRSVSYRYNFCPNCGESLKEKKPYAGPFGALSDVFEDVDKEFQRIDRNFFEMPKRMPVVKFRTPRGSGISVVITSGMGMKPRVSVKTYGEYKKVEPEIRKKLGVKVPAGMVEERTERRTVQTTRAPAITEEPEAEIKELGNKQVIRIKLPDVKAAEDIDIKRLEQSLEVRAVAGDKVYFKLIPIRGKAVESKGFKEGVLTLEVYK